MNDQLVLIHTVSPLIEVFHRLGARLLPGVKLFHILDEPILEQVRLQGGIQAEQITRLQGHVEAAQGIAASVVLVTCSTLSPALDQVDARIPLVKIDQAMLEQAVHRGKRIGVLATNQTTLEPTRQSLRAEAQRTGKIIEITQVFVEGALSALLNGEGSRHDELINQAVKRLADEVEIILLAQASMARVVEMIPEGSCPIPILTSPHTALEQVSHILTQRRKR